MAFLIGGLASLPMGLPGLTVVVGDNRLLLLALGTALLGSLIPYSLELIALRRLPAGTFGILLSLEPVFAALFGWLLLNQTLGTWQLVAIALVISASIGVTVSPPARRSRVEQTPDTAAKDAHPTRRARRFPVSS